MVVKVKAEEPPLLKTIKGGRSLSNCPETKAALSPDHQVQQTIAATVADLRT